MTITARTCTAFLALASAGAFALPAAAEEIKFMAELSGEAQVPPVQTEATGMADVTVDTEAMTISWIVTYEGLSSDPVAGHFHGPASPEETAPPVIDLTVDMEEDEAAATAEEEVRMDIMEGSSELTEEQMADLQAGLLYINIHTPENPDGEIRGQVMEGEAEMGAEATTAGDTMPEGETAADDMAPDADAATAAAGMDNPMVGGAEMPASNDIVTNAMNSQEHTTLVAAVQAAGLVETLQGEGPFTVFAPVNDAFAALPAGTVDTLLLPENKDMLTKVLTAHVVAGNWTAEMFREEADAEGMVHLDTVSGDALSVKVDPSGSLTVFDESGNAYNVTIGDVMQSNGVIHVVDGVLLPQ